ncbi:MAG: AAA family ATPase [Deltaproteobacteria bacterium]|nr:AAA family ATPase [Deltaproteobacteria bacterium]
MRNPKHDGVEALALGNDDEKQIHIEEVFDMTAIDLAARTAFERALQRHPADRFHDRHERRQTVRNYAHAVAEGLRSRMGDTTNRTLTRVSDEHVDQAGASKGVARVANQDLLDDTIDDASSSSPLKILDAQDLLNQADPEALIHGICPTRGVVVVHADSGAGKTFLALDVSCAITMGEPWQGRAVKPGPILYLAAEGQAGLKDRVRAWMTRHCGEEPLLRMKFLLQPLDPLGADFENLLQELLQWPHAPVLIVIDTWSACLAVGGHDEDKARDVGRALAALQRFVTELGATVWILHHQGHVALGRARGSSALRAAADTEIALKRQGDVIVVSNTKQRDLPQFADFALRLCVQELDDGRSSCVLDPAPPPRKTGKSETHAGLSTNAEKALAALRSRRDGATYSAWQESSEVAERSFARVRTELVKGDYVVKLGEGKGALYRIADKGRDRCHHRQIAANGSDDSDQDDCHQLPHSSRGGSSGGNGSAVGVTDPPEEVFFPADRSAASPDEDAGSNDKVER